VKVITYIHKGKVKSVSVDDLKKLKVQLTEAWEKVCTQCGKCCFEKSIKNNVWLINYSKPCKFLKFAGRVAQCTIYSDRFSKLGQCNTIPEAIQKRYLPPSCPYVKFVPMYKAPIDDGSWYKRARIKLSSRYDSDTYQPYAGTPTGGTMNMPAEGPHKFTGGLTREDLQGRIRQIKERKLQQKKVEEGKVGCSDPRQKTEYNIKPSGHALGG